MWAPIQRNDPGVVNHLDEDDDVFGCLKDVVVVVVEARDHCPGHTAGDAPLKEKPILRPVSGQVIDADSIFSLLLFQLLCLRREWRQASVLRLK
jgi:hypothetical protein